MLGWIQAAFRALNRYLEEFYATSPGCCASGGLSRAQLDGERPDPGRRCRASN